MSMGGGGKVKETADEKERATIAADEQQRWAERFKPVEDKLIADTKDTAPERRRGLGYAASETTRAFGSARPKVEAGLTNSGARPGSARFNLGLTGMGEDEGTARGENAVGANNAVDDQYYAGLASLTQLGRGQQAGATAGLSDLASTSARQAQADAARSAENRAAGLQAAGTLTGTAAGRWGRGLDGSGPGTGNEGIHTIYPGADTTNNSEYGIGGVWGPRLNS